MARLHRHRMVVVHRWGQVLVGPTFLRLLQSLLLLPLLRLRLLLLLLLQLLL